MVIGRSLQAWPLPLLLTLENTLSDDRDGDEQEGDACRFVSLSRCWKALGLPDEAADWSDRQILHHFCVQQQKVVAFAGGLHSRLGASSSVSSLDELALMMIAEAVLGRWRLPKDTGVLSEFEEDDEDDEEGDGNEDYDIEEEDEESYDEEDEESYDEEEYD